MTQLTCNVRQALAYFFKVVSPQDYYHCSLLVQQEGIYYTDHAQVPKEQDLAAHALRALAVEFSLRHIVQLLSPHETGADKEVEIRIKRNDDDPDGIKVEIECHLCRSHQFTAFA